MITGDNLRDVGPRTSWVSASPSQNCRVGKTFVAGYVSKKFLLPSWLLARFQTPRTSYESETTSGIVAAFLMSWDMQLANIWANRMGVNLSNM
jgi:hypothetical protein